MRNMTPDEFDKLRGIMNHDEIKKLWEEMMDADLTKMPFSTSAIPLPPLDKDMVDKIKRGYMGALHHPTPVRGFSPGYRGISPTDKDAVGMYEYQEPEQDEQGTFYGYKILHIDRNRTNCNCEECRSLVSPRYPVRWINGQLKADREPSANSMFGIHCTKRPDHPELEQYCGRFHGAAYSHSYDDGSWVLVRCALGGTVVETEQGFRAEYAQIVGVYQDEHWTNYQNYQERANANSRRSPEFAWDEAERYRRRYYQNPWNPNADLDTGSLP